MNGISWRMAREDSMILTFGVLPLVGKDYVISITYTVGYTV